MSQELASRCSNCRTITLSGAAFCRRCGYFLLGRRIVDQEGRAAFSARPPIIPGTNGAVRRGEPSAPAAAVAQPAGRQSSGRDLARDLVHLAARLGEGPQAFTGHGADSRPLTHPAYRALHRRVQGEFVRLSLDRRAGAQTQVQLTELELRLDGSLAALDLLTRQLEVLRLNESLRGMAWMGEFAGSGRLGGRTPRAVSELIEIGERAQLQASDCRRHLHRHVEVSEALRARHDGLDASLAQLVMCRPDFYLDAEEWLRSATQGLIIATPGLRERVMQASRQQADEMVAEVDEAIRELIVAFVARYRHCHAELAAFCRDVEPDRW